MFAVAFQLMRMHLLHWDLNCKRLFFLIVTWNGKVILSLGMFTHRNLNVNSNLNRVTKRLEFHICVHLYLVVQMEGWIYLFLVFDFNNTPTSPPDTSEILLLKNTFYIVLVCKVLLLFRQWLVCNVHITFEVDKWCYQ